MDPSRQVVESTQVITQETIQRITQTSTKPNSANNHRDTAIIRLITIAFSFVLNY